MELSERERERVNRPCHVTYNSIISFENLLISWQEFLREKKKRRDVCDFSINLMDNILDLYQELSSKIYKHGSYYAFKINDPKPRDIHKASVHDRIIHHAVYRILYPYFDKKFIYDSYSCRNNKGTHKALSRFRNLIRKVSSNNSKTAWVLKGDIRRFFATIDHKILKNILRKHIVDRDIMWLLGNIIDSFHTENKLNVGLPLGNVTSQLLINVYMNEFDQFMKRKLKMKYYIRYADDFLILHENRLCLEGLIAKISNYLEKSLNLSLNNDKVVIKTVSSGVDFLGWIHFPHHRVLRTSTKRRMFRKLNQKHNPETLASYLGLLRHGNTYKLARRIEEEMLFS